MRISAPTYTQTPNDLFDQWIPLLNESELKVLLVVIRKTFGWHKTRDRLSISQLQEFTGLSETSVIGAEKSLKAKNLIRTFLSGPNGKQQKFFELIVEDSNNSYPPSNLGGPPQQLGGETPPVSGETKETAYPKETAAKERAALPPGAGFSEKIKKEPKVQKISDCLKSLEIDEEEKIWLSEKYTEEIIRGALEWTYEQAPYKKGFIQTLKFGCSKKKKIEAKQRPLSLYEIIQKKFKHGEKYNGAECYLNEKSVAFERGQNHRKLELNAYFSWEKLSELCHHFGIKYDRSEFI